MSSQFFQQLTSFSDVGEIADERHYSPAPEGWSVIITDVVSSTAAIEAGRYKDVNTIGAASIVVVQNALEGMEIPYVFGGDGSSILFPNSSFEVVRQALGALESLAASNFDLDLRVGVVDISDVAAAGMRLEVGKFEITPGRCIALFRGGGLAYAEKLVRENPERYYIPLSDFGDSNLKGLSCRWNPIPNQRGCVLSIIIEASNDRAKEVYVDVLQRLDDLLSDSVRDANPVNVERMKYRTFTQLIKDERRYHSGFSVAWMLRYFEIWAAVCIFKVGIPPLFFNPRRYSNSMRTHSDFVKFSDQLQMIVDCSESQKEEIQEYLEAARARGDLNYGIHESSTSLMTCFVGDLKDANHIHFIDGGDGGYAMAAKQLKSQMLAS